MPIQRGIAGTCINFDPSSSSPIASHSWLFKKYPNFLVVETVGPIFPPPRFGFKIGLDSSLESCVSSHSKAAESIPRYGSFPPLNYVIFCSHSTFEEVNAAMCASKHWQAVLQDEQIWQQLLKRDWGLTFACDTNLEPISSFRHVQYLI